MHNVQLHKAADKLITRIINARALWEASEHADPNQEGIKEEEGLQQAGDKLGSMRNISLIFFLVGDRYRVKENKWTNKPWIYKIMQTKRPPFLNINVPQRCQRPKSLHKN